MFCMFAWTDNLLAYENILTILFANLLALIWKLNYIEVSNYTDPIEDLKNFQLWTMYFELVIISLSINFKSDHLTK